MIEAAIAGAAMFGAPGLLRAAEPLPPTPQQTAGPFYPQSLPADADNDLVHVAGHAEPAKGTLTRVAGRILDRTGKPLSGAGNAIRTAATTMSRAAAAGRPTIIFRVSAAPSPTRMAATVS
jgi:hypothetical protein